MGKVVVIGGGAAGLTAAIAAADVGDRVTVLERMDRVGKKLLATGNGRCNLMNTGVPRYPGSPAFAEDVLSAFGVEDQRRFWERLGLRLRQEEGGRVYPSSGQASSVLDVLRLALQLRGVHVITGAQVTDVRPCSRGWQVSTPEETLLCDRVIVTGGGKAQSKLGSDGSCYPLLERLGHRLIPPRPALTQITTDTAPIRGLSGIRVKADVTVTCGGRLLHAESGEALFTDYGLSGVCVMQCARYATKPGSSLHLHLASGMGLDTSADASRELQRRRALWAEQPMEQLLTGLCVPRLSSALCHEAGIRWKDRYIGSLAEDEVRALTSMLLDFPLIVTGIKGFDQAQVTSGGIDTTQFDPLTLASRLHPGLHAAGEVLDVDGDCGGFNLMFAFASGILAGLDGRHNPYGG